MNRNRFYQRISGLLDPDAVRAKRIAVIGLGSGGSRVTAELARLGFGLLLIERPGEKLQEHNIIRHLLGYRSMNKLKLKELARWIDELNPEVQVHCQELDVVEEPDRLARVLVQWKPDAIAVCTDNEPSKQAINQTALSLGIPQVGAGVYDAGIGGEIYRVTEGLACYGCIAGHLQLQRYAPPQSSSPDYNSLPQREAASISALNLDIEQIALLQCRLILEVLFGPLAVLSGLPTEINLCVFANRIVSGTFARPFHGEFFSIPRCESCLICGTPSTDLHRDADRILAKLTRGQSTCSAPE